MKKILFIALLILGSVSATQAQKYAFIDVEYILNQMPEYTEAQNELNSLADKYQKEIEAKYAEIAKKEEALKQEEILLPPETRKQRQAEIDQLRQEAQLLQQQKFGVNGELFAKRKELIEPIQNKIYKEVKKMSDDKGYDFVLDKGTNSNILFVNPKYDKSEYILKQLKQ
jgi:outer membrane protein